MDTPQAKAVNETTPKIIEAIAASGKATLVKVAVYLQAQGLITPETHGEANQARTVLEGADKLMIAVLAKVKKNPKNFGKLVNVLRSSDLTDEADMLERECSREAKLQPPQEVLPQPEASCEPGITIAIVKGSTLELKSKGETIRVEWQQWFQRKHQYYTVCVYTMNSNTIPIYIQKGYDIPNHLTVDSRLQYGSQSGVLFFVYHDKGQTPFQHRFIAGTGGNWPKDLFGGYFDPSAFVGEYLHDV